MHWLLLQHFNHDNAIIIIIKMSKTRDHLNQTKGFILLFFVLLSGSNPAHARDPLLLSLDDVKQHALNHNAEIKTARADVRVAEKQIRETTAIGLPQVNASLGYNYYLDIPTSLIPAEFLGGEPGEFAEIQFGTQHNMTATASVEQLVFDGQYIVGLRAAKIYRELADKNLQRSELEVRNLIRETYFLVQLVTENLQSVSNNLNNIEQMLYETQKLLEEGFTDPINVDQLRLTASRMKQRVTDLERQKLLTKNLLKFQAGIDLETQIELTDDLDQLFENLLSGLSEDYTLELEQHIDYRLADSQKVMSLMVLRREQTAYLPRLSASFIRQEVAMRDGFNFFDSGKSWFPATFFTVNLNVPIFSSGMRSAQVQQARIELEKAEILKNQIGRSLVLQMNEAIAELESTMEQYTNEQESLLLAQRIFDRTTVMFREGMATSLELTQANEQLLNSHINYHNAMFALLNGKNKLDKAQGR